MINRDQNTNSVIVTSSEDGEGDPYALVFAAVGVRAGGYLQHPGAELNDKRGHLAEQQDAVWGGGVKGETLSLVDDKLRHKLEEGGGYLSRQSNERRIPTKQGMGKEQDAALERPPPQEALERNTLTRHGCYETPVMCWCTFLRVEGE